MADFQCASKFGSLGMHVRGGQGSEPPHPLTQQPMGKSNCKKARFLSGQASSYPRGAWVTDGDLSQLSLTSKKTRCGLLLQARSKIRGTSKKRGRMKWVCNVCNVCNSLP